MRKGQLQIQESIFVMVIFVVILLIGLVIFYRFSVASINSDNEQYKLTKFRSLIEIIPSMEEFKCSSLGKEDECLDLEKIKAFKTIQTNYFKEFGNKRIVVEIIYPGTERTYEIYNNKYPNTNNNRVISSLVSVYDPGQDTYKIGKLIIEEYT